MTDELTRLRAENARLREAHDLLERMVRAEWAMSQAFDADGLYGHKEAQAIADREWSASVAAAVAFLDISRPLNPFAKQDVPMSAENREKVKRNTDEWLADQMKKSGTAYCPTCRSIVSSLDLARARAEMGEK